MADALSTSIVAVTVYGDAARVTRRGTARLPQGASTAVIADLPDALWDDSVRVTGRGDGVRILGVDVATTFADAAPQATAAALVAELEALQDESLALDSEDARAAAHEEMVRTLAASGSKSLGKGLGKQQSHLTDADALAGYVEQQLQAASEWRAEVTKRRRDLARRAEAAQQRLNQVSAGAGQRRREVRVDVEAAGSTEADLDVTYTVSGASWVPTYDARLVDGKVALTYQAMVRQQTGEDWPACDLALSTARPAISATIPELDPWYLDKWQPAIPRGMAADRMMLQATTAAGGAPEAMPPPAPKMAQAFEPDLDAVVERAGTALTFRVQRPVAVATDGTGRKTLLSELGLDAALDHVTAPSVAEEAYLRATVTNSSDAVLLPGRVALYQGSEFVGSTELEAIAPGEEFELQLGVDDRVKVERELAKSATGKAGLIGSTRKVQRRWTTTITNLLPDEAKVTVLDQVPVPRHEDIKVKAGDLSPEPAERDDLGRLTWKLKVPAGAKVDVVLEFAVEHPKDMTVGGLT